MPGCNIAVIRKAKGEKKEATKKQVDDAISKRWAASSAPLISSPMHIDSDALPVPFSPAPTTPAATIQDFHFDELNRRQSILQHYSLDLLLEYCRLSLISWVHFCCCLF